MVRSLKGAPATVLLLMLLERRPMAQAYISRHTGYSDKVVHDAMLLLADYGMVNMVGRYTWQLSAGAQQLPLMQGLLGEPEEDSSESFRPGDDPVTTIEGESRPAENDRSESFRAAGKKHPKKGFRSESFRPKSSLASSSGLNLELNPNENLLPPQDSRSSENFRANLAELDRFGVREPARSRLAGLAHVTPELIRAHFETQGVNPGQALYRIEHNWATPATAPETDRYRRYIPQEYAHLIEH
ncbi:MAG TPA: hypothetical protein PKD23_06805 [Bellilinea sp.]|nr:hypothetical protein [Bellilinea sp.]